MNGYVEAGYIVGLGTLGIYAVSLLARERAARRRLGLSPVPSSRARPDHAGARRPWRGVELRERAAGETVGGGPEADGPQEQA